MVEMNLLIISNMMVAFGTLVLAYYAYKNIKSSKEQLNLFRSQQEPYLLVQDKQFIGNKIELILSNHGQGTAYDVAVSTRFFITEFNIGNDSKRLLRESPLERWSKLEIKGIFNLVSTKSLLLKKEEEEINTRFFNRVMSTIFKKPLNYHIVYPSSATTFIFDVENEETILKCGDENKHFEFEPYFWVTTQKNERHLKLGTMGKGSLFDNLRDFLIQNNIQFIGIVFNLISRDKLGNVHYHQEIDSCIVELNVNKTLEEAINSGRKVHFTPLGWIEIQKKVKWLPSQEYNEIKFMNE